MTKTRRRNQEVTGLTRKRAANYTVFMKTEAQGVIVDLKTDPSISFFIFVCSFETRSHCVDHVGLELTGYIFLLSTRSF